MNSRIIKRAPLTLALVLFGTALAACNAEDEQDLRDTGRDVQQQTRELSEDARRESSDAWASLRTDGERLVDQVQTRNDPESKQQLLDRCRDTLERLRKAGSPRAGQVDDLCTAIRAADVSNDSVWDGIRQRFNQLNQEFQP